MQCRNCNSNNFKKIINIGKQPISSIFYKKKKFNLKKYSLDLYKCKSCNLIQLSKEAPLGMMYGESYGYQTSISKLMVDHLKKKIQFINSKKYIKKNSYILDIGSNDGTFLNLYKKSNYLFGIDPSSNKFKNFYRNDINRINNFFSKKIIENYLKKNNFKKKNFDLISSFAIFYDISNPNQFCADIYDLLDTNGIWIAEFSYFPLMLKNLTYDQICHEHLTYYTLEVFESILKKNGLKVLDVFFNEINGGSIEVVCAKKESKHKINEKKIKSILKDEGLITDKSYQKFNMRINNIKKNINLFFHKNKKNNIIGYGASTKGNVVLNHCGISNKKLKYICDGNILKTGRYTPGTNIKIISKKEINIIKPNFLFVLIWSFREEVIKEQIEYLKKGGNLVFHLPRFHIITKKNYKFYLKDNFKSLSYNY